MWMFVWYFTALQAFCNVFPMLHGIMGGGPYTKVIKMNFLWKKGGIIPAGCSNMKLNAHLKSELQVHTGCSPSPHVTWDILNGVSPKLKGSHKGISSPPAAVMKNRQVQRHPSFWMWDREACSPPPIATGEKEHRKKGVEKKSLPQCCIASSIWVPPMAVYHIWLGDPNGYYTDNLSFHRLPKVRR